MDELKPCPFCGASLLFKQPRVGDDYHEHPKNACVLAGDLFMTDPLTFFDRPDTRALWNSRAANGVTAAGKTVDETRNALRQDHPLATGPCLHNIPMTQHCAACAVDGAKQ